jgi:hypothetical protein
MTGEKWTTYLFSYYHDGAWWSIEIPAVSREDAETRLQKMPRARYDGELVMTIPAGPGAGLFCRFWTWLMNRTQ